ncbi:hypothetical protein QYE76_022673 [Lolium multiflorum]|uniref:Uncharacterized protein n=1 Tax=Lolium multiflorum TaxID=4521 RepID=A0AAD8RAR0_LOLMU|nr:hypothetical protein QYE76_022673 [Lolium multiflorum]
MREVSATTATKLKEVRSAVDLLHGRMAVIDTTQQSLVAQLAIIAKAVKDGSLAQAENTRHFAAMERRLEETIATLARPHVPSPSREEDDADPVDVVITGHNKAAVDSGALVLVDRVALVAEVLEVRAAVDSEALSVVDRVALVPEVLEVLAVAVWEMEHYAQTESYQLGNGGSLVFERDLDLVSEELERPPPEFHGVRIHNQPGGEPQWMITADLKGRMEPPMSERILFSFKASNWVDGLAHALQEGLARVCGQNIAALQGTRFTHFARHDTVGEPMALSSHPVLKHHVEHLDFMLHETRKDLEHVRVHAHRAQMALAHHADAIRLLAKDRRSLRLQRAKKDATITRLRAKIHTLEATVRSQEDQLQEMEDNGEDIQGGEAFLRDDYEFLESGEDGIIPIDVDEDEDE